ncbi:hypothetical protein H4J58_00160 [Colwellia sp. MB3u-70]|uniref:hypothetical protein n=1 Tax=unclassified Colwellia TaxID=196834 RepID=UPI0015F3E9D7|nr:MULTISPECIES: hypothetical protein [unclassified Colwellia]MBA6291523.1 hypothetical protein [Colwellia sp. MB3u-8]MBA6305561.1 hypothetical protein [Colwellia sp. MB3u-70]
MSSIDAKANKVKSLLTIIFIGALGSGLWDLFLKDSLFYLGGVLVNLISTFYDGYFDYLYADVGKQRDFIIYIPGITIFVLIIFSPWIVNFRLKKVFRYIELDETKEDTISAKKSFIDSVIDNPLKFRIAVLLVFSLLSVLYTSTLISSLSTNKAVSVVQQNLEITRPYISENEYLHLVSKFRLVDDQAKLQNLLNEIEKIATKQKIQLPEFSLYGINTSNKKINKDT